MKEVSTFKEGGNTEVATLGDRIVLLSGRQARIALGAIAEGKTLEEALDIAETYT